MELKSTFSKCHQTARILSWSEHGNVILFLRAIEDVLEIESNGIVAKEVRSGVGLQEKRSESAPLALLVGKIVMKHSIKTGALNFEGSLAARMRYQHRQEHDYRKNVPNKSNFHMKSLMSVRLKEIAYPE